MNDDSYFARVRRGEAPPPAVTTTLGGRITALDLDAGRLESAYLARAAFINPAGHVQGGMLAAMLDDVTAWLVTATLAQGEHCATVSLNTCFLRPATSGPLTGRAWFTRRGRELCHASGELLQEGRPVATASAVCLIRRSR